MEFTNEDVQRVMSKLLSRMQETEISLSVPLSTSLTSLPKVSLPEEDLEDNQETAESKGKTIKPKEFIDVTLARMNQQKLKSQENLKKIAESQEEKQKALMRKKPEINKHSAKIGKRNEPVFERAEKEVKESAKALARVKEKLEKERNDKIEPDLTFNPKLHKPNKTPRTKEQYLLSSNEWLEKKNKKLEKKTVEVEEKLKKELKFVPSIDQNSATIVTALGNTAPIVERLHEKLKHTNQKIQHLREEQVHSFAPVIEENSRAIARHKIEGPVHERLYGLSKHAESPIKSPKVNLIRNKSFSFSNDLEDDSIKNLDFLFDLS